MRFLVDLELGPFRFTFDPAGDLQDEAPTQGPNLDSQAEYGANHTGPELQAGRRDPWYDDGGRWEQTGFRSPK